MISSFSLISDWPESDLFDCNAELVEVVLLDGESFDNRDETENMLGFFGIVLLFDKRFVKIHANCPYSNKHYFFT